MNISFGLIYQVASFFHLALAGVIAYGAYFTFWLSQQVGLALWLAVPIAVLLAIILGIFMEILLYKPMRQRGAEPFKLLIASLGLYIILQNLISIIWGDDTKCIRVGEVEVGHEFLGVYITDVQIITILSGTMLFGVLLLFLKFTQIGKNMRAVSSNLELSTILGINSNTVILWAFSIGSALAAVIGVLVAFETNMTPTMGFSLLIYGVVSMIIGGFGSSWGIVGGTLLLATVQHLGAYFIDSKWMDALAYVVLILFLIWKPLGISGKRLKKVEI
jgi:branched-subunit amino acid ABC-type transport system permease component